jgi:hypothetical protein
MGSFLRWFVAGVLVTGVVAWGIAPWQQGSQVPPDPVAAVRVAQTLPVAGSSPEMTNASEGRVDPAVAELQHQVALLRAEVAKLQQHVRQHAPAAAPVRRLARPRDAAAPADAGDGSAQELPEDDATALEAERQRGRARMAAGAAALHRESPDNVWSVQATEAIDEALAREEFAGTMVQEIDCRATLCQVQVVHADPAEQALFQQTFSFQVGPLLPKMMMQTEELDDGSISATLYLAREGYALPHAD